MLLINIEIYDDRVSNVRWKWIMNKINHMKYEKKAILFSQQQKEKKSYILLLNIIGVKIIEMGMFWCIWRKKFKRILIFIFIGIDRT